MSLSSAFRKATRQARDGVAKFSGSKKFADHFIGDVFNPYEAANPGRGRHELNRGDKKKRERHHRELFEAITSILKRAGGNIPSKTAETATSVRSAQGSPVARSRSKPVFVIPRKRKKTTTSEGVGLNMPQSGGLVI